MFFLWRWSGSSPIIISLHQTHYEKSDWLRAFNQFAIACELDMINAISAADIAFSMSAWLLSPLECSPQKQNGRTLRFCLRDELCKKCIIKQLLNSVFAWYHELSKPHVCVNTDLGFDNSWYYAQPHPIIVKYYNILCLWKDKMLQLYYF